MLGDALNKCTLRRLHYELDNVVSSDVTLVVRVIPFSCARVYIITIYSAKTEIKYNIIIFAKIRAIFA